MTATLVLAGILAAAPVPKSGDAARIETAFGKPVAPREAGTFALAAGTLRIAVPKTFRGGPDDENIRPPHGGGARTDRSAELPVELAVRVRVPKPPAIKDAAERFWAGLTVRENDNRFVEFGPCESFNSADAAPVRGILHADLKFPAKTFQTQTHSHFRFAADEPLWLKLRVTVSALSGFVSRDGQTWVPTGETETVLGPNVTVGVSAWHRCGADLAAEFSEFTVTKLK